MVSIKQCDGYITIKVRVQPKASKNEIAGIFDDALKVTLTAPPVDNEANKALCAFLAKRLKISRGSVSVIGGATGRNKVVAINDITAEELCAELIF